MVHAGGKALNIPQDNFVLRNILKVETKFRIIINLNYLSLYQSISILMSTQFVQCAGSDTSSQLTKFFDFKKSSIRDNGDTNPVASSPRTKLPFYQPKKINSNSIPHQCHYGTRSKTHASTISLLPPTNEDNDLETGLGSLVSSLFGP